MVFNRKYALAFLAVLCAEVLIALFVHDRFIRPYLGDVLVMVVLYTFVRSFCRSPGRLLPVWLFLFAALVEVMQYFDVVHLLGLEGNRFLSIVIGSTFDWRDILCYLVGSALLLLWENQKKA